MFIENYEYYLILPMKAEYLNKNLIYISCKNTGLFYIKIIQCI